MQTEERQIDLAHYGLSKSDPVVFEIGGGIPALLGELAEWLEDDRQWLSPYTEQWVLLLDDLATACSRLDRNVNAYLAPREGDLAEIEACRASLKRAKQRRVPEPSLRRRLTRAVDQLQAALMCREAWVAAFDDLLESKDHLDARRRASALRDLIEPHGTDIENLVRRLSGILEDDLVAVKGARGEALEEGDLTRFAGLTCSERAALCRSQLTAPQRRADVVIWLKYTLAPLRSGRLESGDAVRIYSASWLREAIGEGRTEELPAELREGPLGSDISLLAGLGPDGEPQEERAIPEALIRVALGEVEVEEAMQLARESAELVVSFSVLLGTDPTTWLLTESYARYHDGKRAGSSFHAPPVAALSLMHHEAMRADSMPEFAAEWGQGLADHLPVRGAALRRAARLALWLRRSRESWEPGRIVLCGRVLEQVAGWAGVGDRHRFGDEFLRLSWAIRRVRLEATNCWHGVWAAHVNGDDSLLPGAWEEIVADPALGYEEIGGGRHHFNLAGVIERATFLRERLLEGSAQRERLEKFSHRTQDGTSTSRWVEELLGDFDTLKARERRIRNALVHGGPVRDSMPEEIVLFADWLAADALHAAIQGILAGEDLVNHFLDFRKSRQRCLERLRRGEHPSKALFWDEV